MINLFKTLLVIICFSSTILGQKSKFEIGVLGGPSVRNVSQSNWSFYQEPALGFVGNVLLQYNLKKLFSLRTGINFERKGFKTNSISLTDINGKLLGNLVVHSNFDYLTLPLMAQIGFVKKIQYFANVGPYFGFLLNQSDKYDANFDFLGETKQNNTENINRTDFGFSAGLGMAFPLNERMNLRFEGLFNGSIREIVKPTNYLPYWKHHTGNLLVGMTYELRQHVTKSPHFI